MSKSKGHNLDNYMVSRLKLSLLENMGDLYCLMWDVAHAEPQAQDAINVKLEKVSKKCGQIMDEIDKRGLDYRRITTKIYEVGTNG